MDNLILPLTEALADALRFGTHPCARGYVASESLTLSPIGPTRVDVCSYLVSSVNGWSAVAKARRLQRTGSVDQLFYRCEVDRLVGNRVAVPRILACLPSGSVRGHPDVECVLSENMSAVARTPVDSANVAHVLECLTDLYGSCWGRFENLTVCGVQPLRPRPTGLGELLVRAAASRSPVATSVYGARSYRIAMKVAEWQSKLYDLVHDSPTTIVHGDLWLGNIGVELDRLVLIDWERMAFGNVGADLGHLWLMTTDLLDSIDQIDELLALLARRVIYEYAVAAHEQRLVRQWLAAFFAYLLLEGVRVLWGPMRLAIDGNVATITGLNLRPEKLRAARSLARAVELAADRLAREGIS